MTAQTLLCTVASDVRRVGSHARLGSRQPLTHRKHLWRRLLEHDYGTESMVRGYACKDPLGSPMTALRVVGMSDNYSVQGVSESVVSDCG
jgi:hypothetical protein